MKCLKHGAPILVLLLCFVPLSLNFFSAAQVVKATIDFSSPTSISQFSPALSLIDTTLDYPSGNNDLAAINRVKALIGSAVSYINTPIMAWGVSDPWPDPTQPEPTHWSSLDSRLQLILATGGTPVITLAEAPWWMKGELQPDGTTRLLSESEEWSDTAYASRILDNKMGDWLHLVQRVAERYMVAPYNVRYFQVWNELKGYYDPITNTYDDTTSPGDPSGPNARHGYTYMYNQVYDRLTQVARSLGIPAASIQVGGPYVPMDTWSSADQSNPSFLSKPYGTYDQRPLDVVQYWLQHKVGAGFITVDGDNGNKDNIHPADPFSAAEKFADITRWIRTLNNTSYPGAASLPVWWAEWAALPFSNASDANYNNALKTYAMIEFIKAGGAVALSWGGVGDGTAGTGLWTAPTAGGGQPLPWYYSYRALKDYFPPGTPIYKTTVSSPKYVEALASASTLLLVNKTDRATDVHINSTVLSLEPYQVRVINNYPLLLLN